MHRLAESYPHDLCDDYRQHSPTRQNPALHLVWWWLKSCRLKSYHTARKTAHPRLQYDPSCLDQYWRFDPDHLASSPEYHPHINEYRARQRSSAHRNHASKFVNLVRNFHDYSVVIPARLLRFPKD